MQWIILGYRIPRNFLYTDLTHDHWCWFDLKQYRCLWHGKVVFAFTCSDQVRANPCGISSWNWSSVLAFLQIHFSNKNSVGFHLEFELGHHKTTKWKFRVWFWDLMRNQQTTIPLKKKDVCGFVERLKNLWYCT